MTNKIILKMTENRHLMSFIIQVFFKSTYSVPSVGDRTGEYGSFKLNSFKKGHSALQCLAKLMVPLWHNNVRAEIKKDDILKRT